MSDNQIYYAKPKTRDPLMEAFGLSAREPSDVALLEFNPNHDSQNGQFTSGGGGGGAHIESSELTTIKSMGDGENKAELTHDSSGKQWVTKDISTGWEPHNGHNEVATFLASNALGMNVVPDTRYVTDADGKKSQTAQEFVKGATAKQEWPSADSVLNNKDRIAQIVVLDYLMSNNDRHSGNWMFAADGKVYAIDNDQLGGRSDRSVRMAYKLLGKDETQQAVKAYVKRNKKQLVDAKPRLKDIESRATGARFDAKEVSDLIDELISSGGKAAYD